MSHNIFGVLSIAIVVPILEEFLFRGAIEGHLLRKGWSPKWAILVSALIFGIIHGNPAQIPFAFLIGLLFGWLYYRTRSLVPGIVGHIINNSFGAWTMFTATREELSQTTMETLGTTITYILLVLAIIVFIGMYLYLNKYLPKPTNIQVKAINEQDITILTNTTNHEKRLNLLCACVLIGLLLSTSTVISLMVQAVSAGFKAGYESVEKGRKLNIIRLQNSLYDTF